MNFIEMSCEILRLTHDGDDLSPKHLYLVQIAVNNGLSEKGEIAFNDLYQQALKGYKKPWFHGFENLAIDHEGFVYWRGVSVEHYSFDSYEQEGEAARQLAWRCTILEMSNIRPDSGSAIWTWDDNNPALQNAMQKLPFDQFPAQEK